MANPVPQINIIGKVLNQQIESGLSKKDGKPWETYKTMLLCGEQVVYIVERVQEGKPKPAVRKHGDLVRVNPVPGWQDNGVININGNIEEVAS